MFPCLNLEKTRYSGLLPQSIKSSRRVARREGTELTQMRISITVPLQTRFAFEETGYELGNIRPA